jgi:hypothetical protein
MSKKRVEAHSLKPGQGSRSMEGASISAFALLIENTVPGA